jgi:hypothetical protein
LGEKELQRQRAISLRKFKKMMEESVKVELDKTPEEGIAEENPPS